MTVRTEPHPKTREYHVHFVLASFVKTVRLPEMEQRGRSIYSKHELILFAQQQERLQTSHTVLPKISEPPAPQKDISIIEDSRHEATRLDEGHQPASHDVQLTDAEMRRFQLLKEKFERGEPIDVVFGKHLQELQKVI